jgi:hypothetical protein
VNVPGLYFAGNLAHGKDHLKSAGGFIHGFRYTARALFRILEAKHHGSDGGSGKDDSGKENETGGEGGLQLWEAQTSFVRCLFLEQKVFLRLADAIGTHTCCLIKASTCVNQ